MFTLGLRRLRLREEARREGSGADRQLSVSAPDVNNTFTKRFEHIVSVHFRLEERRWGLRTDLSKTAGLSRAERLLGVMAMPFFNATDKLQFVARYTLLDSDGINGIRWTRTKPGGHAAAAIATTRVTSA